jgi:mRNA interferase MazF
MRRSIPSAGDFVTLSLDPQSGHEQRGRRPALVVSNDLFDKHTGLAFACPIANTDCNVPFHPPVPDGCSLTGFVWSSNSSRSIGCRGGLRMWNGHRQSLSKWFCF